MEKNIANRMADPANRGRPTAKELEIREQPQAAVEESVPDVVPLRKGLRCAHCGRTETPRILATRRGTRDLIEKTVRCRLCGGRCVVAYNTAGHAVTTQPL